MEHKEIKGRVREMNDAQLRTLIDQVGRAIGMNEGARRAAMAHSGMVRRKLNSAGDRELEALLQKLGPEKTKEILDSVNRK